MRPSQPCFQQPPEIYEAILKEHGGNPLHLGRRLQDFGWSVSDAAWVAVNWPPLWLAAAIANERTARKPPRPIQRSPPRRERTP